MATPATAGSAQLSTGSVTTLFNTQSVGVGPCAAFAVINRDTTNDVQVNVSGLHAVGDWFVVGAGQSARFSMGGENYGSITNVTAQAVSGTPIVDFGVVGKR